MARRRGRVRVAVAGFTAATIAVSMVLLESAPGASAASKPLAQSVGRFLDGSLAGQSLEETLVDLVDARATNPGTATAQNPLEANVLNQIDVPIGDALQLPDPSGAFTLGAVNQVAVAKSDGYSYGASGAVSNSGGVAVGGSSEFPANAKIQLNAGALTKLLGGSLPTLPIPTLPGLPALPDAAALGGVTAEIGAVSALAQTASGGDAKAPQYQIAGVTLSLGSPALGALLNELVAGGDALSSVLSDVFDGILNAGQLGLLPSACTDPIVGGTLPDTISIPSTGPNKGAVVIDPANATISVDISKLLGLVDADLNDLPANTDLLGYVLGQLPDLLAQGLPNLVTSITTALTDAGQACIDAIGNDPVLSLVATLLSTLQTQQAAFVAQLGDIGDLLTTATSDPIAMLTQALGQALALGVNIQHGPGKIADNKNFPFTSALDATPNQATPVVADQTLVRAVEVDLGGSGGVALALGNAAAGPSTPAVAPPTSSSPTPTVPTTTAPVTSVPTGVPAGQATTDNGVPTLPIVLLVLGLLMGVGGVVTWRLRGTALGGRHG